MQMRKLFAPRSPLARCGRAAGAIVEVVAGVLPAVVALALVGLPASLGGSRPVAGVGTAAHSDEAAQSSKGGDPARAVYAALGRCGAQLSDEERWLIADVVISESDRHGFDPLFVQALIEVESTCKPTARSNRGAVGLIQIKPSTARAVADAAGLLWEGAQALKDPEFNVQIGLEYLVQLEERFSDPYLAVAAYNLGPAQVARMPRQRARESRYVRRVLARYESLTRRAAAAL